MLGGQDACQLVGGSLVSALEHHARALLRRREGGQNVGGRTRQADGALVDQGVILQRLIGHGDQRLAVRLERAANGQVTRLVQLLDAGDHASISNNLLTLLTSLSIYSLSLFCNISTSSKSSLTVSNTNKDCGF